MLSAHGSNLAFVMVKYGDAFVPIATVLEQDLLALGHVF